MLKPVLAACVLLCALTVNADARPRQKTWNNNGIPLSTSCVDTVMRPCYAVSPADMKEARRVRRGQYIADQLGYGGVADRPVLRATRGRKGRQAQSYDGAASQVVAHPSGCPSRAFCGCGAAVRVFGRPVRDLWLAANWLRFPRAIPAPGMVAARRGHVFVLESHIGGSTWLAWDANSGRHTTRVHPRSIAGFAIVNPHA